MQVRWYARPGRDRPQGRDVDAGHACGLPAAGMTPACASSGAGTVTAPARPRPITRGSGRPESGSRRAACTRPQGGRPTWCSTPRPRRATTLDDTFGNDTGTDPHTPGAVTAGTLRFDLPAGVRTQLGGPGPDPTHYFRNAATAIFTSRSHTVVGTIIAIADGTTGRCSANGAAYLADVVAS